MNGRKDESRGFDRLLTDALRRSDTPSGACPEVELLAALAERRLGRAERRGIEDHLASCPRCRETVVLLRRSMPEEERRSWFSDRSFWRPMVGALATASIAIALSIRFFPGDAEVASEAPQSRRSAPAAAEPLPTAAPVLQQASKDRRNTLRADSGARQKKSTAAIDRFADAPAEGKQVREESARDAAPAGRGAAETRSDLAKEAIVAEPSSPKLEAAPAAPPPRAAAEKPAAPATLSASGAKAKSDAFSRERESDVATAGRAGVAGEVDAVRGPGTTWRVADGELERSLDGGRTWQSIPLEPDADLAALATANGQARWVVGERGTVFRTTDGETWNRCVAPTDEDLLGVGARDGESAVVVTRSGARFETQDGGRSWSAR